MARLRSARLRHRRVPALTLASRLGRATAAVAAVAATTALPLLAGQAHAAQAKPVGAAGGAEPSAAAVRFVVTKMSPSFAQQGGTLTISGKVRNVSGSAIGGLSVRLWSSTTALSSRANVSDYAHGSYVPAGQTPVPVAPMTKRQLPAGHSWAWTAHVKVSDLHLSCFGVYPLTAEVSDSAANELARDPVPLPYWPTTSGACTGNRRPAPTPISWIWPVIDTPHQGSCGELLDNGLAASIAPGGRLATLVKVGAQYTASAHLTWAVDPAVLDNARRMKRPYPVGDSPHCGGVTRYPADPHAAAWLTALGKATAGQQLFVTPYADVDIAALTRFGSPDLNLAYTDGYHLAHRLLGRKPAPAGLPTAGPSQLSALAWPVGGVASPGVLEKLAALGISTVILTMPEPSGSVTPGAVSRVLTGIGRRTRILLADRDIDELLTTPDASSRQIGAIFGASQLYLAQTALIAAQAPGRTRPIVVAPPRRWDPAAKLAKNLLADTVAAPWLSPVSTGQIVSTPPQHSPLPLSAPKTELPKKLLRGVARLDRQVALLESIRVRPDPVLYRAVFGIESSAWLGKAERHAKSMLTRTSKYVKAQLSGLEIGVGGKGQKLYVTLGGKVSTVTVLIHNPLSYPVRIALSLHASNRNTSVTMTEPHTVEIQAHSYSAPVRLTVHASGSGQGIIRLSLTAPNGTPLPTNSLTMHVRPTDFGTVALVICAAALAVFVIASAARALRSRPDDDDEDDPATPAGPDPAGGMAAGADGSAGADSEDRHIRPEYPDSVSAEGPELTTAGRSVADQDPIAPGRWPTEERR